MASLARPSPGNEPNRNVSKDGFAKTRPSRTCGFTIPGSGKSARQSDIPSLRKLQQFDQIMTAAGLWGELALDRVAPNLWEGKIKVESRWFTTRRITMLTRRCR